MSIACNPLHTLFDNFVIEEGRKNATATEEAADSILWSRSYVESLRDVKREFWMLDHR
jgi:hypothetical protein